MSCSFRGLWTRLIFVFALAATALAQAPVSDDTFVTSASPSSTNGSSPSLVVQAPAGWTFIKLDLSRIPAGTQASAVSKATLKLYVTAATAQGAFDVFRADSTWKEANLTYSNSTAPNQSAQALVLTPITIGTCSGTPVQCVTTTSKYVIVDVTSIVKDWLNFQNGVGGSHANNGIALKPSSGSSISVTFESKESTTTGHDSDLEIDYSTSLASIPGTIGPSQVAAGTYAINISGTAATAAQFDHLTNQCATNLFAIGITTAGHANCSPLPAATVFNNQANTFGAGFKQIFTPSATFAGLSVVGAASDPTTLSNGDLWFNTTAGRLGLRSAGVTKQFAFLDDVTSPTNIQNSQLAHSSITINSGNGLNGGGTVSLGGALTLSIPNAGVSNSMLQNSSIAVTAGTGIAVAGTTSLGGAFSIINNGVLSFNGRIGAVVPQNNDYSFAQLSGTDSATSHLVYNNQSNTFGINFKQIFQAGNNFAGLNIAGVSSDPNSVNLQPGDLWFNTGSNHLIFRDGLGNTKALAFTGDAASGDGSGLTNLNASQLSSGTVPAGRLSGTYGISISGSAASISGNIPESQVTNLTTDLGNLTSSISAEASTRASDDTNLQNNINAEAAVRGSADTTLSASVGAETSRAQGAETTITGNLNNEITRATAAEGTKADLVKPVQLNNAAAVNASCSDINGLVLNPNQPSGQQMFICRDIGGGTLQWQLINDDATSTAADHTYTDQQVAAEASARATADNVEAAARQAADTTLQSSIDSEAAARAAADTTETNRATTAETSISNSVTAESVRAITAETGLGASIAAETTRATGAESTITTNLNAEVSRATAAEATKADLVKPVQLDNAAAVNGSCAAVNALVLNPTQASGQQLFICRDIGGGTLQWELINDDAASSAADHSYTDSQITIEATTRQNADSAEASARTAADTTLQNNIDSEASRAQAAEAAEASARAAADAAEALARAAGDAASVATANAYTNAETARATAAEATKANLAGGNSFTGDQTITAGKFDVSAATATLPVQTTNTTPSASGQPSACVSGQMLLQVNGAAGQQLFICNSALDGWVMVNDDSASSAADHTYTDQQIGIEAAARTSADNAEAAARQSADTTLQANIDSEATARAAGDASTLSSANAHSDAAVATEAAARSTADAAEAVARAAGDAAALASANSYTDAETTRATAAEATKANLAGGNSFTGGAQILAPSTSSYASVNVPNSSTAPSTPGTGDIWLTNTDTHLKFTDKNNTTQSIAFLSDITNGTAATISGSISESQVTNLTADLGNLSTAISNEAAARAVGDASTLSAAEAFSSNASNINSGTIGQAFLPGNVVYNNQANTYTAGSKQTFKASATLAGLNIFGVATDPTGPLAAGDAWYNTTANRLKFYNGTVSKNVAFTDDSITGNASTASTFDHTPTQCAANNFATGIAASGNANCSQPSFANLTGQATNSQLQNSLVTVTAGIGLSGGGSVALGGTVTLSNAGVTSLTGTANQVSVSASTGGVTLSLPATINVNTSGNAATATSATTAASLSGPFGMPVVAVVATSQSTTSTTYGDLGTVGPTIAATVSASGKALVTITGQETVTGSGVSCFMGIAISGATTLTPSDTQAFISGSDGGGSGGNAAGPSTTQASATYLMTGLTAGTNTFTAKYKASSAASACSFANRNVIVTPY